MMNDSGRGSNWRRRLLMSFFALGWVIALVLFGMKAVPPHIARASESSGHSPARPNCFKPMVESAYSPIGLKFEDVPKAVMGSGVKPLMGIPVRGVDVVTTKPGVAPKIPAGYVAFFAMSDACLSGYDENNQTPHGDDKHRRDLEPNDMLYVLVKFF